MAKKRGALLEDLSTRLLVAIPGVSVVGRDAVSVKGNEEIDLLVANDQVDMGLTSFGHDLLVECKSQKLAVDAQAVSWFATKVRRRHLKLGVLIALAGVTGRSRRAAAAEVELNAIEHDVWVLVVVESELRGLRSGEHFAACLEEKRARMLAIRGVSVLSDDDLAALDPSPPRPGGVSFRRGPEAMRAAIREARREMLYEVLDEATGEEHLSAAEGTSLTREKLAHLDAEIASHRANPDEDPFWRSVRQVIVDVGATLARMLDEHPPNEQDRHVIDVNVWTVAQGRLRASAGGRLWHLLTSYYLEEIKEPQEQPRDTSIYSALALVVEEMIAIDDIDPRDVYGYPDEA